MSKQTPADDAFLGEGDLPPPYTEANAGFSGVAPVYGSQALSQSSTQPDSLFAAHLASVRCQIRDQQATRASAQEQSDTELLSLLIPHVEDMLASIAAMEPPPRLVQATFIPSGAVSADWAPSETGQAHSGEICSVVRVQTEQPAKAAGDVKWKPGPPPAAASSASSEFDGWGRWGDDSNRGSAASSDAELWWTDENMARRLARHLQPARKTVAVDRQTVAAKVTEAKKGKSRWNLLGNSSRGNSEAPRATTSTPKPALLVEDEVAMTVSAEELTFRRENEMGIWESNTGFGIVVRIKIKIL